MKSGWCGAKENGRIRQRETACGIGHRALRDRRCEGTVPRGHDDGVELPRWRAAARILLRRGLRKPSGHRPRHLRGNARRNRCRHRLPARLFRFIQPPPKAMNVLYAYLPISLMTVIRQHLRIPCHAEYHPRFVHCRKNTSRPDKLLTYCADLQA